MTARVLHADAIWTRDGMILDGALVLSGSRVVDLDRAQAVIPRHAGAPIVKCNGVLFAGFVNAHTHLELSALRAKTPRGKGFAPWLTELMRARAAAAECDLVEATRQEVERLARSGTSMVGEVTNSLSAVADLEHANISGRIFHEFFGLDDARVGPAIQDALSRAQQSGTKAEATYSPSPHTLHTLSRASLERFARAASEGAWLSLHLCEHPAERELLERGAGAMRDWLLNRVGRFEAAGKSPIEYAAELGLLRPNVTLVHLADARKEELRRVADSGASVVLCPRSNRYIEGILPDIASVVAFGIPFALGTDSLASNDSLAVVDEARFLMNQFPEVPDELWLHAITDWGAAAIGISDYGLGVGTRVRPILANGDPGADPLRFLLNRAKTFSFV